MRKRHPTRPVRRTLRTEKKTWWQAMPWIVRAHIWLSALAGLVLTFFICGGFSLLGLGAAAIKSYTEDPMVQQRLKERQEARHKAEIRSSGEDCQCWVCATDPEQRAFLANRRERKAHMNLHQNLGTCDCKQIVWSATKGWIWRDD